MVETLSGFRTYVRFASTDPAQNRRRFYDLRWQPTLFGEGVLVRVRGRQGQRGTVRAAGSRGRGGTGGPVRPDSAMLAQSPKSEADLDL